MKTILVEFTEKEAEMIVDAIKLAKGSLLDGQIGFTEQERKARVHDSATAKVLAAAERKEDVLITNKDLHRIKDLAVKEYLKLFHGILLSHKLVDKDDFVHISLANAFIGWLNSKDLLKRAVRFDHTDDSDDYLGTEY